MSCCLCSGVRVCVLSQLVLLLGIDFTVSFIVCQFLLCYYKKQNPGVLSPGVLWVWVFLVDLLCVSSDPGYCLWCAIISNHLTHGPCGGSKTQTLCLCVERWTVMQWIIHVRCIIYVYLYLVNHCYLYFGKKKPAEAGLVVSVTR